MAKAIRILLILLSIATGALFLYSAWTKLFPIESFEYTMVEFTHIPLLLAKIAARFFIGLEAALGALMILHLFGRNNVMLRLAFGLLAIFSAYLVFLWASAGNNVNCGCFGDAIWMSPSTSLLKNAGLLMVTGILIRYHKGINYRWTRIAAPVLLAATIATAYIVSPVYQIYKIDLTPLYTDKKFAPPITLSKGKYIIAFVNPSCMHCRKAAIKMRKMKENNPALPFFMVIGGVESDLTSFWKETQAQNIPYTRLNRDAFLKITGGVYPQIFWVNNSYVEENTSYPDLDQKLVEKWMK